MTDRKARTRYAVLGMLTIEPMSGYDLAATIDRTIGHFWREGYGRLYPTLKELTAQGLVVGRAESGRGPRRTVHQLTEAGWAELRRWLATPPGPPQAGRDDLLLQVFFARHAPAGVLADHVRRRREVTAALLARYEEIASHLRADPSPDARGWHLTVRHGIHLAGASIAWCDEALEVLGGSEPEAARWPST
ncbi:MAG: PadR family transcriptional regulator [Actinotalea sp.]|nr:PadR family transcriptional regulator [Actinotalea sp.]